MASPYFVFLGHYDREVATQTWAKQLVKGFLPNGDDSVLTLSCGINPFGLTLQDEVRHALFLYFYSLYTKKVDGLVSPKGRALPSESLEEIVDTISDIDRVREIQELNDRALAKHPHSGIEAKSVKIVTPNSLRILRDYLKGLKRRPKWTLNMGPRRVVHLPVKQESERRSPKGLKP
jgi:hypothetical protein